MDNETLLELLETVQAMMLDQATGKKGNELEYADARTTLMDNPQINPLLPRWIRTCSTLTSFEQIMKSEYPSYAGRREAIKEAFEASKAKLKGSYMVPIDTVVAEALDGLNLEHIQITWQRALARIHEEPDAAITSARTLLESTCKSILEHYGASEADYKKLNLQNLFLKTWESLGTSQQQKSLEQIQTKLGELIAAFGTLRNEYGDAHGRGLSSLSPTQLEAEFAVNLAGTMTLVLIRRFEEAR